MRLKSLLKTLIRFDLKHIIDHIKERHFEYFPNNNNALVGVVKKNYGVLFQHKRSDEVYEESYEPIYPDATVPPLMELLNRDEHPEHDMMRFKLLKWMINEELLGPHDLDVIPKKYLMHLITLVFMTTHSFITVPEADLILFTIRQVDLDLVPIDLKDPEIIDPRAYRISLQFNRLAPYMIHSFSYSGLTNYDDVSSRCQAL